MGLINRLKKENKDLLVYMKADEIHPHDIFLDRMLLRFLPKVITPNILSLFRILVTPYVFYLIAMHDYLTGAIVFLLVAFTDAMDGSLARTQHKITKLGMLLDPLADKLLVGAMVIVLVFQHFPTWIGLSIVTLEIIFIISAFVLRVRFKTVKMANNWGKIKMLAQVIAVFVTLLALLVDFPLLFTLAAWLFGLSIGFALLSLYRGGV